MLVVISKCTNCPLAGPKEDTTNCCFITSSVIEIMAEEAFDTVQTQSICFNDILDLDCMLMVDV